MQNNTNTPYTDADETASSRKKDHIELAFASQINAQQIDTRFYYEPLLNAHATSQKEDFFYFLGKKMKNPIWVSSMTGGTDWAGIINRNLGLACGEFGLGMGLGSCRLLLTGDDYLKDFDIRQYTGHDVPLYANLGIAQIEHLLYTQETDRIFRLVEKLSADGLIIHINPMQEWLQPEGDRFQHAPIDTIRHLLDKTQGKIPFIVKEVGQGMGINSLRELFKLPLAAIDFAASGGTNFAMIEMLRNKPEMLENFKCLALIGHSAEDMVNFTNFLIEELKGDRQCKEVIISGGVQNFLDGYYYTQKIHLNAIYGQASAFLKHARGDYESLRTFITAQIEGFNIAKQFLRIRKQ